MDGESAENTGAFFSLAICLIAGFSRAELAPTLGIDAGFSRAELAPTLGIDAGFSRPKALLQE